MLSTYFNSSNMKRYNSKSYRNGLIQNNIGGVFPIAVYRKAVQAKIAKYLQLKTEGLNTTKKKISLLLFSFLFGGCSIVVMLFSFWNADNSISAQRITFPKYVLVQQPKPKIRDSLITYDEYARINRFKHYLEHLQADATGRKVYDSLLQVRPFLIDSIHQVDSIFLTQ